MTNENNNINELVADDDDPTVALEILTFGQDDNATEADLKTYDVEKAVTEDSSSGLSVSELQSDLRSRNKTISKLQFDMQKLHTKWLGLEAEIGARESQTEQLNNELSSLRDAHTRQEKLLQKRDRKIHSLQAEIRQRDKDYQQLTIRLEILQASKADTLAITSDCDSPDKDMHRGDVQQRVSRTEEYADSLRQLSQDLIESNTRAEGEIDDLTRRLDNTTCSYTQLSEELTLSVAAVNKLHATLADVQRQHDDEIRLLRFDLGAAEDTIVETDDLNSQLASDLVDASGFKDELERMLGNVEEQSAARIEELQKEVRNLNRNTASYEHRLATKSEAISILLAELAKRSEQVESIGEIENVIHDIDERISEHSSRIDQNEQRAPSSKITRVLIGTIDNQVLQFPLFKDRLTIGRTKNNDIQVKAGYVSRRHAVIQTDGSTTRIIDWGSKNGIHVNSTKVSEHFLRHGDTVIIGNARFRYEERKKRNS